jgi:glycosyltransferase involved in cell wall biosynthesis
MMTAPLVTIVIPTFNRSAMLGRCVESALAQTQACEVIVVDHGSTDDTPAVAASFGERIRYLRREVDHGVHFCWLDGVVNARGQFVHLNFDDDFLQPTFVEKCMALMSDDVALCLTVAEIRDEATGRKLQECFTGLGRTGVYAASRFMTFQLKSLVSPGAILMRRQDMLDTLFVGRVPFARHEYRGVGPDWLMPAMATLRYPKIGFVAEPLAVFSAHEGSITVDAQRDKAKKKAMQAAYQAARRYYVIARVIATLRLDLLAGLGLFILRVGARIAYGYRSLFNRKSPRATP